MGKGVLNLTICAVLLFLSIGGRLHSTPEPIFNVPNLEPKLTGKRPDFMVPAGTTNLARGKKVIASVSQPIAGSLDLVTDGDKAYDEGSWVELGEGRQWIQIDLEQVANVYAILVWHYYLRDRVYFEVAAQVSNDSAFKEGAITVFDNTEGTGKDRCYIETYQGKLIDAKGAKGRYVRLYSNGNTDNKMNHYIEVEVFGKLAVSNSLNDKMVPLKTDIPRPPFR